MENSTGINLFDLRSSAWDTVHFYHPYCIAGLFAVTGLLSLIYLACLFFYRAYNPTGALLSSIFVLSFLFSSVRVLLLVQEFYPEIQPMLLIVNNCVRTASICSLFGLVFVAVVRSSECEYSTKTSVLAKLTCIVCLVMNYSIAGAPSILGYVYTSQHIVTQAALAGVEMYFMVVLFIMGLSYMFMLPRTIANVREVKSATAVPKRLVAAALVGFMAALLLLAYVLFLLAGFLALRTSFGEHLRVVGGMLPQLHSIGTSGTEALLTGLLVIAAVLLINTPPSVSSSARQPDISHTSGPELQGLLYHGRSAARAISPSNYRAQPAGNGFHSLYKADA